MKREDVLFAIAVFCVVLGFAWLMVRSRITVAVLERDCSGVLVKTTDGYVCARTLK